MNTTPAAAGPGFLAALLPLIRYDDSLEIKIGADDGRLDITVAALGHAPLKALGAPIDLERELPAAVAKYAEWVGAQEAAESGKVEITLPGEKSPARASTSKPAPRVRKATPKRARKKPAAKKKPATRPAPKKKSASRRTPAPASPMPNFNVPAAPDSSKPGKAECLADLKALRAKFGNELTRRGFIKQAKTGRRYERLWKNWEAFTAEPLFKSAAVSKPTPPAPAAARAPKKEAKKASPKPAPATKSSKPAKEEKSGPWAIKLKGKQIGATIFHKKAGDTVALSQGNFTVLSVDPEKREIQIAPADAKAERPAAASKADAPAAAQPAKKPAGPYAIKDADGKLHGATLTELAIGDKWGAGERWEVAAVDHNKREYTLKNLAATPAPVAAAAEPTTTETP